MALDTYANLQTAIGNLLGRTDLTTYIPDWITMAESDMKRRLKRTSARAQFTINAQSWTMPAEIDELRSVRLVTGSPGLDVPIQIVTPEVAAESRAYHGDTAGRPQKAFIVGRQLVFTRTPDTSYTIETTHFTTLSPLSASNTTNSVLQEAPDAYLYGSAIHSAPFLGDDSRLDMWRGFYLDVIEELNKKRDREEYSASLRPQRLPRVFG